MKAFLQWSLDRLKEKTTWIGIVGLASSIGWYIDPDCTSWRCTC